MSESHVRGANTPPLLNETIGVALERAAKDWQRRPALISRRQNIEWTYEELNARADALATGFLELGFAVGDRVGIWAPNCAEWTLTQFACAKAGIILVTVNPAYRKSELEYALNKSGCRALVLAKAHRGVEFAAMLRELRGLGVALAVDDFGTGYSGLAYLRRFPIDVLKLDRSFVLQKDGNVTTSDFVKAFVDLAHALNMAVVAEGVETAEVLELLRAARCDQAQGYLLARPMPLAELRHVFM